MPRRYRGPLVVIACVEYELDEHMHTVAKRHSLYFDTDGRCADQVELTGNEQMAAICFLKQWRDRCYDGSAPEFAEEFIDRFLTRGRPAASMIHAAIRDGWEIQIGRPETAIEPELLLAAAG